MTLPHAKRAESGRQSSRSVAADRRTLPKTSSKSATSNYTARPWEPQKARGNPPTHPPLLCAGPTAGTRPDKSPQKDLRARDSPQKESARPAKARQNSVNESPKAAPAASRPRPDTPAATSKCPAPKSNMPTSQSRHNSPEATAGIPQHTLAVRGFQSPFASVQFAPASFCIDLTGSIGTTHPKAPLAINSRAFCGRTQTTIRHVPAAHQHARPPRAPQTALGGNVLRSAATGVMHFGGGAASSGAASRPTLIPAAPLRCSYCCATLRERKYFAAAWPELIMCARCSDALPSCHVCHRKAAEVRHTQESSQPWSQLCGGEEPLTSKTPTGTENGKNATRLTQKPPVRVGGLNLCGGCASLGPVLNERQVERLLGEALEFLHEQANISFNDTKLFPLPKVPDTDATPPRNNDGQRRRLTFPYPVQAADLERMRASEFVPAGDATPFGCCETLEVLEKTKSGWLARSLSVKRILVAKGLPESVFRAHLAHELLHAFIWCTRGGERSATAIDRAVEEGLCNTVTSRVLQLRDSLLAAAERRTACAASGSKGQNQLISRDANQVPQHHGLVPAPQQKPNSGDASQTAGAAALIAHERRVIAVRLGIMANDTDKIYGEGYRVVRKAVDECGFQKALHLVRTEGSSLEVFKKAAFGSK
ncbi:hypothetical protein BESB_015020 [Besnoitia besnoiti]|uniref:Protein DA1-like domain-containing protein n=1 Tax=Besnoitia besnoiti TaxID=94643 RepID=A0A2A9M4L4_BESBE|nr:hypothetical protein BESB_015020 [Besnoitia besnoiti]PFH32889.1 hypothetical protein BESB_015020 [Besnoitia besnoiti]